MSIDLAGVEQAQLPEDSHDQEQQTGTQLPTVCINCSDMYLAV